ncbi:MAG: ACP S-malonyltransferase [Nitrosomonas sp.]|nr:ACP S-malonyltransferase [Nitrosomonas sp.]
MKTAFVFPGQGSQSIGMMQGYADNTTIRATFEEASDILQQDIWTLVADGPESALNLTVNTQPIMLVADIAIYRAWQNAGGIKPAMLAGHSLGEYAALVVAEALDFADALQLVRYRAQVMQESVPDGVGGMAAIVGLDDETVATLCQDVARELPTLSLTPANFNAPGQVVIAGHKTAVLQGVALAKQKGAKLAVLLPVSIPSHCPLMREAADRFSMMLQKVTLKPALIPILHNVDFARHAMIEDIRRILGQQLYCPVHWTKTIQIMVEQGVTHIVECGPGKVLSGLIRRIDKNPTGIVLSDIASLQQAVITTRPCQETQSLDNAQ